jgi:hypothetical protein
MKNVIVKKLPTNNVHASWNSFSNYMKRWYYEIINNKKVFSSENMTGYIAQKRVTNYAKKHPEVKVLFCDDSVFSSSIIVLIPHPTMGITMIYIPQNNTKIRSELFLYPDHSKKLIEELTKMHEKCLKGSILESFYEEIFKKELKND